MQISLQNESFDELMQLSRKDTLEQRIADIHLNLLSAYVVLTLRDEITNEIACFATLSKHGVYENLYVFAKYRRKGYARKMDELVLDTAAKRGFRTVYTTIRSDNEKIGKRLEDWTIHRIKHVHSDLYLETYKKDVFKFKYIFAVLKRFICK